MGLVGFRGVCCLLQLQCLLEQLRLVRSQSLLSFTAPPLAASCLPLFYPVHFAIFFMLISSARNTPEAQMAGVFG